jgi:hypothetical protein
MARPRKIDPDLVAQAKLLAAQTDDIQELRMAQAILLPALAEMTLKAVAKVLGVGPMPFRNYPKMLMRSRSIAAM